MLEKTERNTRNNTNSQEVEDQVLLGSAKSTEFNPETMKQNPPSSTQRDYERTLRQPTTIYTIKLRQQLHKSSHKQNPPNNNYTSQVITYSVVTQVITYSVVTNFTTISCSNELCKGAV